MSSDDVLEILVGAFMTRGVPKHIRRDNGPEFIAKVMRDFLNIAGVEVLYLELGSLWQSGFPKSFNGRFRDELLNAEIFASLVDVKARGNYCAMKTTTNIYTARSGIFH